MSREKHFFKCILQSIFYYILLVVLLDNMVKYIHKLQERFAAYNRYKSPELSAAQPNCIKVEVVDLETNTSTIFDPMLLVL